ncbi:PREDICTED: serine/threonine-protein kinase 3-like, partial [Chlamydotis macqueenii]|uniref:serine/threonine-protein kinase 3-like n=1 Tax=Chlamydotis macqueenii TaxID=187382 RepID=UPI000529B18C
KLKKLSEDSLTKQPEEVFDVLEKLGEGSYGSVFKAIHKESGQVVAIKQVPVESDLQEIIKEISIMQQCDSPYVVKYYGSYFKNTDLWIVMEYCGAGSVSDIIRLRNKTKVDNIGLCSNGPKIREVKFEVKEVSSDCWEPVQRERFFSLTGADSCPRGPGHYFEVKSAT